MIEMIHDMHSFFSHKPIKKWRSRRQPGKTTAVCSSVYSYSAVATLQPICAVVHRSDVVVEGSSGGGALHKNVASTSERHGLVVSRERKATKREPISHPWRRQECPRVRSRALLGTVRKFQQSQRTILGVNTYIRQRKFIDISISKNEH